MIRYALAIIVAAGVARAEPLPHEYEQAELGACLVTESVGPRTSPRVIRIWEYARDDKQRVVKETITFHGMANSTSFTYDSKGQLASSSDGDREQTRFEHDPKTGRLVRAVTTDPLSPSKDATSATTTYRYDNKGRHSETTVTTRMRPGPHTIYTYDAADRVSTIVTDYNPGKMKWSRQYDAAGLLVRVEETDQNPKRNRVLTYKYDAKRRRTEETSPTGWTEYVYDCTKPSK